MLVAKADIGGNRSLAANDWSEGEIDRMKVTRAWVGFVSGIALVVGILILADRAMNGGGANGLFALAAVLSAAATLVVATTGGKRNND